MQVSKWGNSLAVRLPKRLIEDMGLKPGDELIVVDARKDRIAVEKDERRKRAIENIRARSWTLPVNYKFDRNLVYAQQSGAKGETAKDIVAKGGIISVQVLNERVSMLRRKLRRSWRDVEDVLNDVTSVLEPALPLTVQSHVAAHGIAREDGLSFYDALIVASALEAGCDTLYSEDLQHGRAFAGLTIHNPFLPRAAD